MVREQSRRSFSNSPHTGSMHFLAIFTAALCGAAVALPSARPSNAIETLFNDGNGGRIVGGHEIDITTVPFQVSVQLYNVHFCGGSIIAKQWVLTAGHCAGSSDDPKLSVRVGSIYHDHGGQVVNVRESIQHPLYDGNTIDYDFSLLKLDQRLAFSRSVVAISLPVQDEFFQDGTLCLVSGWGDTLNVVESNNPLRATDVPLVNDAICQTAYMSFGTITERMICAGYQTGGQDACQGDSGGPLVFENKLVGVVSWGKGCAEVNYPGIYGRVASIRSWIKEVSDV